MVTTNGMSYNTAAAAVALRLNTQYSTLEQLAPAGGGQNIRSLTLLALKLRG